MRRFLPAVVAATAACAGFVNVPAAVAAAVPVPSVASVSPSSGAVAGGGVTTVHGSHFSHVGAVLFGSARGSRLKVVSATTLVVTAPPHVAGVVDVRVVNGNGAGARTSAKRPKDRYTYVAAPVVSKVAPKSGPTVGGTRVALTGTGFVKVTKVLFGTTAGSHVTVTSARALTVVAPRHSAGTVDVRVVTGHGTSAAVRADRFGYVQYPYVDSLDPSTGSTAGGDVVTIHGTGFSSTATVTMGTAAAHVVSASPTQLVITTPPHAAGDVDVRVTTATGTSPVTPGDDFSYTAPATGLHFAPPNRVDNWQGKPRGASCTSSTFCLTIDNEGNYFVYDGTTWSGAHDTGFNESPSITPACLTPTSCFAVDQYGSIKHFDGSRWTDEDDVPADGHYGALSCPTTRFCLAAGATYAVFDGTSWAVFPRSAKAPADGLQDVSCVASSFCAGVDFSGNAVTYNGTTWSAAVAADPTPLISVSCVVRTFCVAVDGSGNSVSFDGTSWSAPAPIADGNTAADLVSCTSTTSCVALGSGGSARYDGSTWTTSDPPLPGYPTVLACAGASACIAADQDGNGVALSAGGWSSPTRFDPDQGWFADVSCPAVTFCAAVDIFGNVVTHTKDGWSAPVGVASGLGGVSCASATSCVAIGFDEYTVWDGQSWSSPAPMPSHQVSDISCVASLCRAVDQSGAVLTFDGGTWTSIPVDADNGNGLSSISCPSTTFCMATDGDGRVLTYASGAWSAPTVVAGAGADGLYGVSCASPTLCAAADGRSMVTWNGTTWSVTPELVTAGGFSAVSCAASSCLAVTSYGYASAFHGSEWSATDYVYGDSYPGAFAYPQAVSCADSSSCAIVDLNGNAVDVTAGP